MSDTQQIRPRPVFSSLPEYAAGKPPAPVEGLTQYKLSSNENPHGPVPEVARILADFTRVHRYPDPLSTRLRERLSERLNVPAADIVTGAGSLGALEQIIKTFAGANADGSRDEVIYAWRSFEAYPILVGLAGAASVQVPNLPDGSHDLEAMLAAITERTRVILLCTPNNPTGTVLSESQVRSFMERVPKDIVVVLDEAYFEFCSVSPLEPGEQAPVNGVDLYGEYANLVLLRTFSKAQGLAGLRVGYSISQPAITRYLRVAATPFAVTSIAEEAAVASIDHEDQVMERVNHLVSERERVVAALQDAGYFFPRTFANFVWLPLGEKTPEFVQAAAAQALSVRAFGTEGVRVSIGEDEANDRMIALARDFAAHNL